MSAFGTRSADNTWPTRRSTFAKSSISMKLVTPTASASVARVTGGSQMGAVKSMASKDMNLKYAAVLHLDDVRVVANRVEEKDGYCAVQVGVGNDEVDPLDIRAHHVGDGVAAGVEGHRPGVDVDRSGVVESHAERGRAGAGAQQQRHSHVLGPTVVADGQVLLAVAVHVGDALDPVVEDDARERSGAARAARTQRAHRVVHHDYLSAQPALSHGIAQEVITVAQDVTDSRRAEEGIRRYAIQQTAIANLSHLALSGALCPNASVDAGTRLDDVPASFVVVTGNAAMNEP